MSKFKVQRRKCLSLVKESSLAEQNIQPQKPQTFPAPNPAFLQSRAVLPEDQLWPLELRKFEHMSIKVKTRCRNNKGNLPDDSDSLDPLQSFFSSPLVLSLFLFYSLKESMHICLFQSYSNLFSHRSNLLFPFVSIVSLRWPLIVTLEAQCQYAPSTFIIYAYFYSSQTGSSSSNF